MNTSRVSSAFSVDFGFHHYLPVSDRDMQRGLYLTGAGRGVIPPGQPYPPAEHPGMYQFSWRMGRELPEFQFILITEGRGKFESEPTGRVELTGETFVVLFPGVWHRYSPELSCGWTERWISLHGEVLHHLVVDGSLAPKFATFSMKDANFAINTFDAVLDRVHSDPTNQSAAIQIGAMQLLTLVLDHSPARTTHADQVGVRQRNVEDELVRRALEIIWTQSHRSLSVDNLCSQLPTTRRTLERRFANTTGHSLLDEINFCRLSRAKRLLAETTLPVKSIAHLAGFGSQERLRLLMIEEEGYSPSQFRTQLTEDSRRK